MTSETITVTHENQRFSVEVIEEMSIFPVYAVLGRVKGCDNTYLYVLQIIDSIHEQKLIENPTSLPLIEELIPEEIHEWMMSFPTDKK